MQHNFNEKTKERFEGKDYPVFKSQKYEEARKKAVEILESEQFKNVLNDSDFWILMNRTKAKDKMMYTGLILSHNACLKINDVIENKVKPERFVVDINGYKGSLVYTYQDEEVYEVGEVSERNCKNDYPYAMAFKRCFDRVVLKKSKLAYAGIYSDSEADEFKEDYDRENNLPDDDLSDFGKELCMECNNFIEPATDLNGNLLSANRVIEITKEKFGKPLCWDCACKRGKK